MTGAEIRLELLDKVRQLVCQDRNNQHGDAEDNFARIAQYWGVYLRCPVSSLDVAILMSLFKIARMQYDPDYPDNHLDLIGYATCGAGIKLKGWVEAEARKD